MVCMVCGIALQMHIVQAFQSASFQVQHEFPNYSDRIAKTSDTFAINEDGTTWYMKPVVSSNFQVTTSYEPPVSSSSSSSSSTSTSSSSSVETGGSSGGGGGMTLWPSPH